jgi:hypothetical protein
MKILPSPTPCTPLDRLRAGGVAGGLLSGQDHRASPLATAAMAANRGKMAEMVCVPFDVMCNVVPLRTTVHPALPKMIFLIMRPTEN